MRIKPEINLTGMSDRLSCVPRMGGGLACVDVCLVYNSCDRVVDVIPLLASICVWFTRLPAAAVTVANHTESCTDVCRRVGQRCSASQFDFLNQCATLAEVRWCAVLTCSLVSTSSRAQSSTVCAHTHTHTRARTYTNSQEPTHTRARTNPHEPTRTHTNPYARFWRHRSFPARVAAAWSGGGTTRPTLSWRPTETTESPFHAKTERESRDRVHHLVYRFTRTRARAPSHGQHSGAL